VNDRNSATLHVFYDASDATPSFHSDPNRAPADVKDLVAKSSFDEKNIFYHGWYVLFSSAAKVPRGLSQRCCLLR
jgi:hypothetical protein